jgi:hypothetical protein
MPLHKLPRTKLTLEKRAATLRTLLTQSASEYKLLKAAERVREARIQVLRATIGEIPSVIRTPQQNRRIAKLGGRIESLLATTPMTILEEFRRMARPKASELS